MKKMTQILAENQETILEGIIYSTKEEVCQKRDIYYSDNDEALKYMDYAYEDVEIFYEETWRRLKEVKREFSIETLNSLRRSLFKMMLSTIKLMARIDKSIDSKKYCEHFGKEKR